MATESDSGVGWWILAAIVGWIVWTNSQADEPAPSPPAPVYYNDPYVPLPPPTREQPSYSGGLPVPTRTPLPLGGGTYKPIGGYENPAPGDDGTFDCAPGQGPVYVGPGDPNGLDGDGDGVGCES
jgi:hypothetical protein